MTVAPNLASSMDLSAAILDTSGIGSGTLLLMVGVLVTLAAARTVFGVLRLIGILFRAIAQLFRAFMLLVVSLGLIVGWGYQHLRDADNSAVAPAPISAEPTLGPLATPHR